MMTYLSPFDSVGMLHDLVAHLNNDNLKKLLSQDLKIGFLIGIS
jgi:hypothetical protein